MLSAETKDTLLAIKFKTELLEQLDKYAALYPTRLLISQNQFQKESRLNKPFGLVFTVNADKIATENEQLQTQLPSAYRTYIIAEDDGNVDLAIVRPTDKYELLRIMGTNAEKKFDLDTGTLVARLRRWEEEHGLEIVGAGQDWVRVTIERIPGNLREFVEEIIEFAPPITKHATVQDLEKRIKEDRTIHIQW